ncbi:MCE family protein [Nocardioides sp. NPDC058538]|uniref:MCE family protein n=1 Tax=Nocardioides sp. NPDC058538 TaxID=3346542 RepID=UPI0036571F92
MKTRILATMVALMVGLTGCSSLQPNDHTLPGQPGVGGDGYTVTVTFDEVANLVPNSAVQMDNVVIGTVAGISVSDWQAKVRLRLMKSARVPADATFAIGQKTLLGAQYVDVSAPEPTSTPSSAGSIAAAAERAEMLRDGARIPVTQTGTYPATEQVLGAVALLLNNGGLSQIETITSELATALDDRVPDTRNLVRRTNQLLAVLDDNKGEIVQALEALDRLSAGLARDRTVLANAIDEIAPGLRTLEEERQSLVRAVTRTGETGAQATKVIRASRTALLANLDALRPILASLGKVGDSIPEALKLGLTIPFPAMTTTNALSGDYTNLFVTLDLRGSSLTDTWLTGGPTGLPPAGATASTPAPSTPDDSGCLLANLGGC